MINTNFLDIILEDKEEVINVVNIKNVIDVKDAGDLLAKNGILAICGSSRIFNKNFKKFFSERKGIVIKRFCIISGDITNINTALPIDSRQAFYSAMKELSRARPDSHKIQFATFFLKFFKVILFPIYKYIFIKQFRIIFQRDHRNLLSFLAKEISIPIGQMSLSIYKSPRKFILPMFNTKNGQVLSYAKIYIAAEDGENYGKNEADALRYLQHFSFETAEPPRIISSSYFGNNFINVISSKRGLENFRGVTNAHFLWIKELAEKTGKRIRFEDALFFKEINNEMQLMQNKLEQKDFALIRHFYQQAIEELNGKQLIFSFINWDFDYYELLRHKEKNLAIDWEHAKNEFPPAFNIFSLFLSMAKRQYFKDVEQIFFGSNTKNNKVIESLLRQVGVENKDGYFFFFLFIIDRFCNSSVKDQTVLSNFLNEVRNNETKYKRKWLYS